MHTSNPETSLESPFSRNVLTLVTGTTIAQIITIFASPIITRLYGPEAFGLVALFASITGIISVIACLRYELAILLPESDEDAANVFGLSIFFVIIVSSVSIIPLTLFQQNLLQFLKIPQFGPYIWLIPPMVLVTGIFLALNSWNTRTKHYTRLTIARVMGSSSSTVTQIGIGFFGYASGGALIGASVLGQIMSTLTLGIQIMTDHFSIFRQKISWNGMIKVFNRYKNFPKYDVGSALLNTISWQIPIFLLSYFFSTAIVGFYSLGMMVIQLPMSFIGSAIAQVFYQQAAEAKREGTLATLVENMLKVLLIIGIFPILILTFIGSDIFSVIFGLAWAEAGVYTQILSIWALIWFISSPLSLIYIVFEKQEFGLKYNIVNFFTRLGSLIIGGLMGSPIIALGLFAISGIFVYGYLGLKMLCYADVKMINVSKIIVTYLLMFVPVGIILTIMKFENFSSVILVITATIFCLIYYAYIIKTNHQIQKIVLSSSLIKKVLRIS